MNDIVSAPARTQPDALRASLLVKAFDGREVLCRLDWEVP